MRIKLLFSSALCLFYLSTLNAQDWQQQISGVSVNLKSVFFLDANNGYAVGEAGTFLKTTNAGTNWISSTTSSASDLYDVYFFNTNTGVITGSGGLILRTTNGGTSWTQITTDVFDNLYSLSFNGQTGIAGGSSQTILRSIDGGASWATVQSGFFGGGFNGAQMVNTETGYIAGQNSIFQPMIGKTTNSGSSWDFTPFYINSNEGRLTDLYFFNANNGIAISAVWDGTGGVSKTTDGGANWSSTIFGLPYYGIHFYGSIGYIVGDSGYIYKSTDAGSSWQSQNSGTSNLLEDVSIAAGGFAFAVGDNGTILKSVLPVPVELISFTYSINKNIIELKWETASELNNRGFEIERAISDEITKEWINIGFVEGRGTSTEKQTYSFKDEFNNSEYSGKIFYRLKQVDFNGQYEYSDEIEIEFTSVPEQFSLYQNYPNPFNPSTVISYALPFKSNVRITVYNMTGEKIAELEEGIKEAGFYRLNWNAGTHSSGIYFYVIQAGDFTDTKKMMLLK